MDKKGHKEQPRVGGQHLRPLPWKPTSLYPVSHEAKGRLGCNEIPKAWAQGSPFSFMWSPSFCWAYATLRGMFKGYSSILGYPELQFHLMATKLRSGCSTNLPSTAIFALKPDIPYTNLLTEQSLLLCARHPRSHTHHSSRHITEHHH